MFPTRLIGFAVVHLVVLVVASSIWYARRPYLGPALGATDSIRNGVHPPVAWAQYRAVDGSLIWYEEISFPSVTAAHIALNGCVESAVDVVERVAESDPSTHRSFEYAVVIIRRGSDDVHTVLWTDGTTLKFIEGTSWKNVRPRAEAVGCPIDIAYAEPTRGVR